jgi:hypothetical protein
MHDANGRKFSSSFGTTSGKIGGTQCKFGPFSDAMIASEQEVAQPAPRLRCWVGVYREKSLYFLPKTAPLLCAVSPSTLFSAPCIPPKRDV